MAAQTAFVDLTFYLRTAPLSPPTVRGLLQRGGRGLCAVRRGAGEAGGGVLRVDGVGAAGAAGRGAARRHGPGQPGRRRHAPLRGPRAGQRGARAGGGGGGPGVGAFMWFCVHVVIVRLD